MSGWLAEAGSYQSRCGWPTSGACPCPPLHVKERGLTPMALLSLDSEEAKREGVADEQHLLRLPA